MIGFEGDKSGKECERTFGMEANHADDFLRLNGGHPRLQHGKHRSRPKGEVVVEPGRREEDAADAGFSRRSGGDHVGDCLPGVWVGSKTSEKEERSPWDIAFRRDRDASRAVRTHRPSRYRRPSFPPPNDGT